MVLVLLSVQSVVGRRQELERPRKDVDSRGY